MLSAHSVPMQVTSDLKLYVFSMRPRAGPESGLILLAHSLDEAAAEVRTQMAGKDIEARELVHANIKDILAGIDTAPESKRKEMGKTEFVQSLRLAADTLVTDTRDKATLKRIIKKLDCQYAEVA